MKLVGTKIIRIIRHRPAPKPFGLGDAVAVVAQPIARMIDAASGGRTNVAGCGGCKQRQADWNAAMPDLRHPFTRPPANLDAPAPTPTPDLNPPSP